MSSDQEDIRSLQEDRRLVAEAQVGRDYSDKLLKWIIGLMLSCIIAGGGLYGKWITDSIHQDETSISRIVQRETLRDENLDILNSKIDLILNHSNLEYNGPTYKHIELPDTQK
jgi:hypothetical protein